MTISPSYIIANRHTTLLVTIYYRMLFFIFPLSYCSIPAEPINGNTSNDNTSDESSVTENVEMIPMTPCPAYTTTQFTDTLENSYAYVDIQS